MIPISPISPIFLVFLLPFLLSQIKLSAGTGGESPLFSGSKIEGASGATDGKFQSEILKCEVAYLIYLPPSYEKEKDRRWPVVYWYPGEDYRPRYFDTLASRLNQAAQNKLAPEMIVVQMIGLGAEAYLLPSAGKDKADLQDKGSAKAADASQRPAEAVLLKELIPHIDKTYRTLAQRDRRAIEGFFLGTFGAMRLGFGHPEVFGIISLAPGSDRDYKGEDTAVEGLAFAEKNKAYLRANLTAIRIVIGKNDSLRPVCEAIREKLKALGIPNGYDLQDSTPELYPRLIYESDARPYEFYFSAFQVPLMKRR
ncbi:MAG: alpha/beta hydrolase-fold protein [Candidatus Sumerlaeota bacterium]|nr:alpha/beta hydrolase-fold protein [Candidatus Sumerlaeota bacterium]